MRRTILKSVVVAFAMVWMTGCGKPRLMVSDDLDRLAASPPGEHVAYGPDPLQYGELSVPDGSGPHPVVIFIHGGCWLAKYDMAHTHALAEALVEDGLAVWNLEYRRVGDDGGGWPGTFQDIAVGADYLRQLAVAHDLDLERVIAMGHSAGGHLALWLAGRSQIDPLSELYTPEPLNLVGVIGLAPAPQLAALHEREVCGHVIDKLMGGGPQDYPQRYRNGSPSELAPLGVPQTIIVGKYDEGWAWAGAAYVEAAILAGDQQVTIIEAPRASHFEVINPRSSTWPIVQRHVGSMLKL